MGSKRVSNRKDEEPKVQVMQRDSKVEKLGSRKVQVLMKDQRITAAPPPLPVTCGL